MERGDKIQRNSYRAIKHKCLKLMAFDNVENAVIFPVILIFSNDFVYLGQTSPHDIFVVDIFLFATRGTIIF